MKRSEMIELIQKVIDTQHPLDADWILSFIEDLGMLPPSVYTNATGWEVGKGKSSYQNVWEPEDEKI